MEKTVYVYDLPISLRRRLCVILDSPVGSPWKLLAEKIGLSYNEIVHLELAFQRPGGSPTEDLLTRWGVQNPTKADLIAYLDELGFQYAADLLRNG